MTTEPQTSLYSQALALAPTIGFNSSLDIQKLCPSRKYQRCFWRELNEKYPVTQFRLPPLPKRCGTLRGDAAMHELACAIPPAERMLVHAGGPKMTRCKSPASLPPPASSRLSCRSPAAAINERAVLLLGVPSSPTPTGLKRRTAIRQSWMRDSTVGDSVVVCFLLSARTPEERLAPMREEQAEHGDMLFLASPGTAMAQTCTFGESYDDPEFIRRSPDELEDLFPGNKFVLPPDTLCWTHPTGLCVSPIELADTARNTAAAYGVSIKEGITEYLAYNNGKPVYGGPYDPRMGTTENR